MADHGGPGGSGGLGQTPLRLDVMQVDGYDRNPRLLRNPQWEALEASIRAQGFHDALLVTRRPGSTRYMLAAGSNTSLQILQHLAQTTGEERFRYVAGVFQPYASETRLLAQHLGENLSRGDMLFWEVASGMVELLRELGHAAAAASASLGLSAPILSLREQARMLQAQGLRVQKSSLQVWQFAVQRLAPLGTATALLTQRGVAELLQPRLNAALSCAQGLGLPQAEFWTRVVDPVLVALGQQAAQQSLQVLDLQRLCAQVEASLAEAVHLSPAVLRKRLGHGQAPRRSRAARHVSSNTATTGAASEGALSELHRCVSELAALASLSDLLIWDEALALGFELRWPTSLQPELRPHAGDTRDAGQLDRERNLIGWSLALLSAAACRGAEAGDGPTELLRQLMVHRLAPAQTPVSTATPLLRRAEAAAVLLLHEEPSRWQRWLSRFHESGQAPQAITAPISSTHSPIPAVLPPSRLLAGP